MEGFDAPLGHPFLLDGLLEYLDVFLDSGTEVGFLDGELRLALGVLEGRDRTAGEPLVQCLIGASSWRRLLMSSWMLTASCWFPRLMEANASLLSAIRRW